MAADWDMAESYSCFVVKEKQTPVESAGQTSRFMPKTEQTVAELPTNQAQESKWYFLEPDGRFSRGQFAFFYFVPSLITLILGIFSGLLMLLLFLFAAYVAIIAGIRRLHDLNRSGWYLLLAFIPIMNIVMLAYLLFAPGKVAGNRWLRGMMQ
jgi:uncharacterized membrane protein YhaH (DUF805 family)